MKLIVAGSRTITDAKVVAEAITESGFHHPKQIVSGCARGVDTLGEQWAIRYHVMVKRFPADWDKFGKRAGFIRNEQMADYADALVAIWDGESRGTKHMIDQMVNRGKLVHFVKVQYIPSTARQKNTISEVNGE